MVGTFNKKGRCWKRGGSIFHNDCHLKFWNGCVLTQRTTNCSFRGMPVVNLICTRNGSCWTGRKTSITAVYISELFFSWQIFLKHSLLSSSLTRATAQVADCPSQMIQRCVWLRFVMEMVTTSNCNGNQWPPFVMTMSVNPLPYMYGIYSCVKRFPTLALFVLRLIVEMRAEYKLSFRFNLLRGCNGGYEYLLRSTHFLLISHLKKLMVDYDGRGHCASPWLTCGIHEELCG